MSDSGQINILGGKKKSANNLLQIILYGDGHVEFEWDQSFAGSWMARRIGGLRSNSRLRRDTRRNFSKAEA